MTLKLLVNILVTGINIFILFRYIYLLYHKRISPSLAMWTFFTIAVGISLMTYFADGNYSISDNILNFTDLITVGGIAIAIYIWGDKSTRFNNFDLFCLGAVGIVIVFWMLSKNHFMTNFAVQIIMVISYFPVVKRMLNQKKNTESFSVWIFIWIAPVISLLANEGLLASIYAIRAVLCSGILLALMLRIEIQNKKRSKAIVVKN